MLRSQQRQAAIFALYQHEVTQRPLEELINSDMRPFTRALIDGVIRHQAQLDQIIQDHASGWDLDRIAPLERSILRVSLLELTHPAQLPAERTIPPEVAIDEAVETAKQFCSADTPAFINGILGAVLVEIEKNKEK